MNRLKLALWRVKDSPPAMLSLLGVLFVLLGYFTEGMIVFGFGIGLIVSSYWITDY